MREKFMFYSMENVTCKRDLQLRDRDVWLFVRDETSKISWDRDVWTKSLETETSRPRLHPWKYVFKCMYYVFYSRSRAIP